MKKCHIKTIKALDDNNNLKEKKVFDVVGFYNNEYLVNNYPMIVTFAKALLSLPHSGAAVERAFSKLKVIKSDKRANLAIDTLQSLMIVTVNNYNPEDPKLLDQLYDYYASWHPNERKRKYSGITKSNSNQEINEANGEANNKKNMEMEVAKSDEPVISRQEEAVSNEMVSVQLKKLKLTSVTKT